ncbi:MAG: glycerophosphodiester phosphodiesterase [Desulfobacterales bacterium]|nr:MAG: glycerophosphodiester phosphodiesterase [Desulfobacterales bacterium]
MRSRRLLTSAVVALAVCFAVGTAFATAKNDGFSKKIVIAHRGASGYLPEHTLEAYAMAYALGADYVEPDLVMTKDGILICLHDIHLERTTDVEQKFPERARPDGRWYPADFTLAEIKTLSVHERANADGSPAFPNRFRIDSKGFQVPTFVELVEMVLELNRITGRAVGIYPETKEPSFHDAEGLPMEESLLDTLATYGYEGPHAKVFIQSFDPNNLKEMRFVLETDLPLVQLISGGSGPGGIYDWLVTEEGLDDIATYANGLGPSKTRIEDATGNPVDRNALVRGAHARGLVVHPYTFRADSFPAHYKYFEQELRRFYFRYGVDGLFTDHTDKAVRVMKPAYRKR